MRCKTCDYPLWQITDRRCPECGTAFVPSEFEFILNSVKFCCPHCEQDYYGTGEKGHLVPRSFACVRCAKQIDMDEMVLLPADGVTERQTEVTVVPWVERRERGWFTAFFRTTGMAIANPNRTIEAVPESSSAGRAMGYMWIHTAAQVTLSGMFFIVGMFGIGISTASGMGATFGIFGGLIGALLLTPLLVLAWAGLAHGVLRMTGQTAGPFRRTLHGVCYSAGNAFPMAIPCLGFYLSPLAALWWSISAAFMVRKAQNVSGGRAAMATVLPIVLVMLLTIGGVVTMVLLANQRMAAMNAAISTGGGGPNSGFTSVWKNANHAASGMSNRLQMVASGASGMLPAHGGELILDNRCWPGEFVMPGSATQSHRVMLEGKPLHWLTVLTAREKSELRRKLHDSGVLDRPAHRVGDWVFTHTGITPDMGDDGLWLAVGWWDPAFNPSDPAEVAVAMPNYQYTVIAAEGFDAALKAQNELRATHGLPALPHPREVTEDGVKKGTGEPRP